MCGPCCSPSKIDDLFEAVNAILTVLAEHPDVKDKLAAELEKRGNLRVPLSTHWSFDDD